MTCLNEIGHVLQGDKNHRPQHDGFEFLLIDECQHGNKYVEIVSTSPPLYQKLIALGDNIKRTVKNECPRNMKFTLLLIISMVNANPTIGQMGKNAHDQGFDECEF